MGTQVATHTFEVQGDGRVSDDLTVSGGDIYIGEDDVTDDILHFAGDTEQMYWDEVPDEFRVTDDLSISGDLTVLGGTRLGDTTSDSFALISAKTFLWSSSMAAKSRKSWRMELSEILSAISR